MKHSIPTLLASAMNTGGWHDPGPAALRSLLSPVAALPDLRLFVDPSTMESVRGQIEQAGYRDDPEFCMVNEEGDLGFAGDPRLVFGSALFVGGSIFPGDDVLVALDVRSEDPRVLVLDWSKPVPSRWVEVGRLSEFVSKLGRIRRG